MPLNSRSLEKQLVARRLAFLICNPVERPPSLTVACENEPLNWVIIDVCGLLGNRLGRNAAAYTTVERHSQNVRLLFMKTARLQHHPDTLRQRTSKLSPSVNIAVGRNVQRSG